MTDQPNEIYAEPPPEPARPAATSPKTSAGGFSSVTSAMSRVWREMGINRGVRSLLRLNQPGGIDCMSCAWPDPDEGRRMIEFCENGAKALAWEADTDRANPDFFARHSVAELSQQSDHWLGQQGRITQPMQLA